MIKPIDGFDGYYVSDDGIVFSNIRMGGKRQYDKEMHEVKGRPNPRSGYCRVYMRNSNGRRVDRYVHRLVAETFIPNPSRKPCVNHKDCDRSNNRADNLEWVSYKENNDYTLKVGRMKRGTDGRFKSCIHGIV